MRIGYGAVFAAIALIACTGNSPISVADRFVGKYYVEFNQRAAMELSAGPATARLQREIVLVGEARRGHSRGPPQPRVRFSRNEEPKSIGKDALQLRYLLSIESPGKPLERYTVIEVRKIGGQWKVVRFTEAH